MKAVERLAKHQANWQLLDAMCSRLAAGAKLSSAEASQFASLYRSVCADLALADAYELPPPTVAYLHRLVARAHHQLYRGSGFQTREWLRVLLEVVPQRVFHDRCVQFCFVVFWGLFLYSAYMAYNEDQYPRYAIDTLGEAGIAQLENNFADPLDGREFELNLMMAAMYIQHNTGIGLQSFVSNIFVVPGLLVLRFNALYLGAAFGYMARPEVQGSENFFEFVTAHGPFELTAIVLSAGAGLRLGLSWIWPRGYARIDSLRYTVQYAMPIMGSAMIMFFFAAMIEGFLSPSAAPYVIKAGVALASSLILVVYFVGLGIRREMPSAA